jgi:uncharacterized protein (TIGR02246 family)
MRPAGRFWGLLVATLVVVKSIAALAGPAEDASAVIDCWTRAFNANDVDVLVQLYAPDAILVGTQSVAFLTGREAVRTYFSRLAKSGDKVKIDDSKLILLDANHAYATGFYTFSSMRNGETRTSPAGFTMILVKCGNTWMIAHHHSSRRSLLSPASPIAPVVVDFG